MTILRRHAFGSHAAVPGALHIADMDRFIALGS
jgi:hypothetical protein